MSTAPQEVPMLILLAIPLIVVVALVHRLVQAVAPSNLLVRRVRSAQPRWRTGAVLLGLATVLLLTMHVVADAVSAGAPAWLNLVVLVLAWDAIKIAVLAAHLGLRALAVVSHRTFRSGAGPVPAES